jgi:hypothetical protein
MPRAGLFADVGRGLIMAVANFKIFAVDQNRIRDTRDVEPRRESRLPP